MNEENQASELEILSKSIGELDRLRFVIGLAPEDRIAIEQRMIALRESERLYLLKQTQASFTKLEAEIEALKSLKKTFEQKWTPISKTQAVLDNINRIIHSLLDFSEQAKCFIK